MLRNTGIRSKVLAVLALPVLVLVLAAGVISAGALGDAARASRTESLVMSLPDLSRLVRAVQTERALTAAAIAGDSARAERLTEARTAVDSRLRDVDALVAGIDGEATDTGAAAAVRDARVAHASLTAAREAVDAGSLSAERAAAAYGDVVAADVAVAERVAAAEGDIELAAALRTWSGVERTVDLVLQERDLLVDAVAAGEIDPALRARAQQLAQQQDVVRDQTRVAAGPTGIDVPAEAAYGFQQARRHTVGAPAGEVSGIDADGWRAAAQAEVAALTAAQGDVVAFAAERTGRLVAEARGTSLRVVLATAALVLLPVLLALFIARQITQPLRRLTDAAAQVRDRLPALVDQAHAPGEAPELDLPEIPVESEDEVGRLARAFNEVNTTTVQVARDQAALRGSIAAMFVNVARRDQVLLSRQLAFIDQLERTEENPQTLENLFRLDHLATRMRRNAESLLVLAGIDTGRRLRRPLALSDVVRTASSEIEHYERVDLALQVDPPMVGHNALAAAHLLAELLENATNFSDPGSRVVVSTASGPQGVVVTITDEGLGMSPAELADANARIADPPASEMVGAQRLGFYVVGRIARRLEIAVELRAGRERGTAVRLELPPALFVPGTVVELPAAEPAPAAAATAGRTGTPAAQPGAPAVAPAPPAAPGLPVRGMLPASPDAVAPAPRLDSGGALPTRRRAAADAGPPVPAAQAPRSAAPPAAGSTEPEAARGGLFSSFRPRTSADGDAAARPGTPAAPSVTPPAAAPPVAAPPPTSPAVPAGRPAPSPAAEAATTPLPARPAPTATRDILPGGARGSRPRFARRRPGPPAPLPDVRPAMVAPSVVRELRAEEVPAPRLAPSAGAPALARRTPGGEVAPAGGPASPPAERAAPFPAAVQPVGDVLRQRSALASEALTELSLLSTYTPPAMDAAPPAALARRTPAATPAAQVRPQRPAAPRRTRDAADVRSMLSGFQAGVQRGRTTPEASADAAPAAAPAAGVAPHAVPAPRAVPQPPGHP